ncbi:FAD-binding oxidoreductase [Deinococcus cavernae]|uniref:FAD-binding oxidoreductase n=1 Tax=Deinococcus cavernae TaxID=2320857 RepID=A0A418V6F5_9DEIO|nr:FAD-dependent oxidoreductase [Deinococcus cavernae]RJF71684.1 FAD-binding oxidoreductase [Deinococcus cavernae]
MERTAVVIGAGIAGASVAYFLSQTGFAVTVVDAGVHAASHVPSALINPVRGQSGQVDAQAILGMHFTWALIRELSAQGHTIPHGQDGVLRPIPDDKTRAKFERNLPTALKTEWLAPSASPEPLSPGWAHVLRLPEAGWVDGEALCSALLQASGAAIIQGRAEKWTATRVQLIAHSSPLSASTVIFCGGSVGSSWAGETATHRMGSMLRLARAPTRQPLSFGAYVSPDVRGGVLGGTFETPAPVWQEPHLPPSSLEWLLRKGEALTDLRGAAVTGVWTGSRLSGLRGSRETDGSWRLSGLSSKGFLLGPLLASGLAQEIAQELAQSRGG